MLMVQLLTCVFWLNDVSRHCDFDCDEVTSTQWHDIQWKSWLPVWQWYCILWAATRKWLWQSLVQQGAYLADDDTPVLFGQCDDTCTHTQTTVKTHTEVGFRIDISKNASDGNHKQEHMSWLLLDQATRHITQIVCTYDVLQKIFFHVPCLIVFKHSS